MKRYNYNLVKVNKLLSETLVHNVLDNLNDNFGVSILGNHSPELDKEVLDSLTQSVYNKLRREANKQKIIC